MLIRPSAFWDDPYGYLTNQVGHIGLGVFMAFVASRAVFELTGEFPVRLHVWVSVLAFYVLVIELTLQGWRGFDTIEDTAFTCFYGAGAPLWVFKEVAVGSGAISGDAAALDLFFLAAGSHLALGVSLRLYSRFTKARGRDDRAGMEGTD